MKTAPSERSSLRAWLVVFILLLLVALAFIDRMSISLMVDPIKASLGMDNFRTGILQGPAFAVFFLIGSMPMGWIVDRFSARWTICLSVTAWSLATIACGLAGTFTELLITRCLVGLGEAVLQPASWSLVSRLFPANRLALVIGVLSAGSQVGTAISYLIWRPVYRAGGDDRRQPAVRIRPGRSLADLAPGLGAVGRGDGLPDLRRDRRSQGRPCGRESGLR